MRLGKVSYYAHHHGSGHMRHAQKIANTELFDLQLTSTENTNTDLIPADVQYVPLVSDILPTPDSAGLDSPYFHYVPTGEQLVERFAGLNQAWQRFKPDLVLVDVSVEVAVFAKLSGYRVALRRMPGRRDDQPHQLGYAVADALFAYYPPALEDPQFSTRYGSRTHYLGTPRPRHLSTDSYTEHLVVVQTSLGASISLELVARAAAQSPAWQWHVLGCVTDDRQQLPPNLQVHGVVADPGDWMARAEVVITSAGHNALAAAAAALRPTLVIPEPRPFDEQEHFAQQLRRSAAIPILDSWQSPVNWAELLAQVAQGKPNSLAQALFVSPETFSSRLETMFNQLVRDPR